MESNIKWLKFTDDTVRSVYPEIFKELDSELNNEPDECSFKEYILNILVLCKEKPVAKPYLSQVEIRGTHKIMASILKIGVTVTKTVDNPNSHIIQYIAPKNISASSIIGWCPMKDAIPKNIC